MLYQKVSFLNKTDSITKQMEKVVAHKGPPPKGPFRACGGLWGGVEICAHNRYGRHPDKKKKNRRARDGCNG